MAFMASMISTKTVDDSHKSAATPKEIKPTCDSALMRASSRLRSEPASTGKSASSGSQSARDRNVPEDARSKRGSALAERTISNPMNGTSAAIP